MVALSFLVLCRCGHCEFLHLGEKGPEPCSRTQLAFRVELAKDLIGISAAKEEQQVLGSQRLDIGRFHLAKDAVLSERRQHFAEWAANAATSVFVWNGSQTISVI